MHHIRYSLRQLRRNPGFALVALITLALGIGANAAIFSVLEAVVLAPLPYSDPDRLVLVLLYNRTLKYATYLSYPDFLDWERNVRSFEQMAAFTAQGYDMTNPGTPEHLDGMRVSAAFFRTLGVKPAFGRDFSRDEDRHGGAPAVIISDRLWRDRFGSSVAVIGKPVTLNGVDYTLIGVLPPGFPFGRQQANVYVPIGQGDPVQLKSRTVHNIACIARLKQATSQAQAKAEMNTVQENIDLLYPDAEQGLGIEIFSLKQALVGDVSGTLLMLLGAVGVVLLIACANVANLLLARSAARSPEFAIRAALGANRAQLVRQLITESLVLSVAGGALGLGLAKWALSPVLAVLPASLPRTENIGLNVPVLLFTFAISVAIGILFGLTPALKSSKPDLEAALKEGGRGSAVGHQRAQRILVTAQTALTLILLVGAGLLFRTIQQLWQVNPGFGAQHVITFKVGLSPTVIHTGTSVRAAYQQLLERIRRMPGMEAADLTTLVPLSGDADDVPFWIGSQKPASIAQAPRASTYSVGPDYLRVMGIPLLRGRFFSPKDTITSEPVVVIDSVFANRYFGAQNPVGQTVTFANAGRYRIIGVVGHVRHWSLGNPVPYTQTQAYTSFFQIQDQWMPIMRASTTIVIRTPLDIQTVMPAIKAAIYSAGSDQPIYALETMQQIISESMSSQRLPMILLGIFAGLALVLASVGMYGVISYSVTLRMREIGIRFALGAEKRNVFRMVIGQGLRLVIAGLAIGAVAVSILTRLLSSFSHLLYGVGATDTLTFIAVSLILTAVAILACYIPAHRATKVDPMVILRHE